MTSMQKVCMLIDSHEREDVIAYQKEFLEAMAGYIFNIYLL
jgi:hypothetical protein